MGDIHEATLDVIQEAMMAAFQDGRLLTTMDGAASGKVRVMGNIDLPEPVVKSLLGDLYDGAVSDSADRSARGSGFAMKDGGQIGDGSVDFDNP